MPKQKVLFLFGRSQCGGVSLAGAATSIIFVATKVLSQKTCACHDKTRLLS